MINTPLKIIIGILVLFVILTMISTLTGTPEKMTELQEATPQNVQQESLCVSKCKTQNCIHNCNLAVQNQAAKEKDIKLCNQIQDKEDKAECTRVVNSLTAENSEDFGDEEGY